MTRDRRKTWTAILPGYVTAWTRKCSRDGSAEIVVAVEIEHEEGRPVELCLNVDDAHRLAHRLLFHVNQLSKPS